MTCPNQQSVSQQILEPVYLRLTSLCQISIAYATTKSSLTRRVPSRGTPRVPQPLPLSPFSPPDRDRRVDSPAFSGRGSRPSRGT